MKSPAPGIVYKEYSECIWEQLTEKTPETWDFKQDKRYYRILEHVHQEQAHQFLEVMRRDFRWLLDKHPEELRAICYANDVLGKPLKVHYPELDVICAATNFQYMYHACLVLSAARNRGEVEIDFLELGGGYGGMAMFVLCLAQFFDVTINSYSLVDLTAPALLQKAYLNFFNLHVDVYDGTSAESLSKISNSTEYYFISAFAFSEFSRELQDWYAKHLLSKCWGGWVAWNFSPNWPHLPPNHIYDFVDKPMTIVPETPRIMTDTVSFIYW